MRLVTIAVPPGGRTGVVIGETVLDFALARPLLPLAGWVPAAMPDLLAAGSEGLDLIRRLVDKVGGSMSERLTRTGALKPLATTALLAPVPRPGIVLSHGRAYKSHLAEMNSKGEDEPHAFMKNVNAIIGPGAPIVLPPQAPSMVDLEGEFSVVFGAPCHNVAAKDALDYVAGYTLINDVSARDWVPEFQRTKDPDKNRMGKQIPTFCPMGPAIATKDEIADPDNVHMVTTLNGKVMQDSNTNDLIWNVRELIAYYSRWYRFMPGDLMSTGSPAGVGYGRNPKVFMQPGDEVTATADAVGTLRNPVRAAEKE